MATAVPSPAGKAPPIGPTRTHAGTPGDLSQLSTDGVRPAERLDYWHEAHLGRMALSREPGQGKPFEGRVRRILGLDSHLMEHESDALVAVRSPAQCRRDGVDYVSINLMLDCRGALVDHGGQHRLGAGSLYFIDSALPVEFRHPRHRSVSIFVPRGRVQEAAGPGRLLLPASLQARTGMGAVLQAHMRMVALHAAFMSPQERVTAISACADMALALVQSSHRGGADTDQFAGGYLQAARRLIRQRCSDPELDPSAVARALGCSRASLYRLFQKEGQSVAAAIWTARLEQARSLLVSASHAALSLSEIAFCSGFVDQSGFNRMFKRRFGVTPGQARADG